MARTAAATPVEQRFPSYAGHHRAQAFKEVFVSADPQVQEPDLRT